MPFTSDKKWGVLIVASFAVFIMVIDTTIMNVSISALVEDLNTDLPAIQFAISVYALIMASFMLFGSKIQDVTGRKKSFILGVILYGAGTFIASVSWNISVLLFGWSLLEGLGAAFMLPATASFLTGTYEGRDRTFAFGLWGGVGAAGAAFGPIVGGFLTTFYSWRWAFRLELLVVVAIILLSYLLTETKPKMKFREIDVPGTIISFAGLSLIIIGILSVRNFEMWDIIPVITGSGMVLLGGFYIREKRRKEAGKIPLVDVGLFQNRIFNVGNIVGMIQNMVIAGVLFIIPVFLQSVTGVSAFLTGVALLPLSLSILFFSVSANRLSAVTTPRNLLLIGFLTALAGTVLLRNVFSLNTVIGDLIPGSVIFGVGVGIILSQLTNLTLSSATKEQESDASGILNTTRQLGTSLGTAVIGIVLFTSLFMGLLSEIGTTDYSGYADNEVIAEDLLEWEYKMQKTPIPKDSIFSTVKAAEIPDEIKRDAKVIVDNAVSGAMKTCFDAIALILLAGFFAVLFLPRRKADS